jgi:hypothetical protein
VVPFGTLHIWARKRDGGKQMYFLSTPRYLMQHTIACTLRGHVAIFLLCRAHLLCHLVPSLVGWYIWWCSSPVLEEKASVIIVASIPRIHHHRHHYRHGS